MISVILWVADVEESLAFYAEKMGLKPGTGLPGPDGKQTFSDMSWLDTQIFLQKIPAVSVPTPGFELYVKLDNDADIDAMYDRMRAKGVEMYHEIKDEFWGERSFGVKDMNGFHWRVAKTIREMSVEEMTEYSIKSES